MSTNWKEVARVTLESAESESVSFPEAVKLLIETGFDGYAVDFRRATRVYYRPDGETFELGTGSVSAPVGERFNVATVKEAIREAQSSAPGYTYKGFCDKVAGAGCAGYIVSFPGKRVLYYGRTAEVHTEYFPS